MDKGSSRLHDATSEDDDDCCSKPRGANMGRGSGAGKSTDEALFHQLAIVIKARHMQLGGYSHDEHEHLLQAKELLRLGHESQARLEVRLALQKRALHAREALKYQNLVALRDTLQEAQRNLTLAQLIQQGTAVVQDRVSQLSAADLRALRVNRPATAAPSTSQPLLMREDQEPEAEEEEEAAPTVTEEEVAAQLALLRLPPTPSTITTTAVATEVPRAREAICN